MLFEPVHINGLAGPVTVEMNTFTGKSRLTVGGIPVEGRRGHYQLPMAAGGSVAARVRATLFDPYPVIEINGMKHRTGPTVPVVLRVLILLPLVLLAGGLMGGLVGGLGVAANISVARGGSSTGVKAALMILVLLGAALAYLVVAAVLFG